MNCPAVYGASPKPCPADRDRRTSADLTLSPKIGIPGYLATPLIGSPVADAFDYGAVVALVALIALDMAVMPAWRNRS